MKPYLVVKISSDIVTECCCQVCVLSMMFCRSVTVWIGLDLFNDDTRPSGHISRPTQVNVSWDCFHSLNNYSSLIILRAS